MTPFLLTPPGLRRAIALVAGVAAAALLAIACVSAPLHAAFMMSPPPYRAKEFAFVFDGARFHLIYMRHDSLVVDNSTEHDFGHAVSYDLNNWTQLDPILPIRPSAWDNFHVWSPTIVKADGTWYLFYAGVTEEPGVYALFQRIGLASSSDLSNWTRLDQPIFGCSQVPWVYCDSSVVAGGDFRDPFVMPDPSSPGGWLMYYPTRPDAARDEMVTGIASSAGDLKQWSDLMPMWNTDPFHSFSNLIESPIVFEHDGLWYLFYTTNSGHPINFETSASPTADSLGWSHQSHLSDEITSENTDAWFGPEFLRVGPHDYFCAVNSEDYSIEIREIVWGTPPHFSFAEPSTAGLGLGGEVVTDDLELRLALGLSAAPPWRLEIISRAPAHVQLELLDLSGRRVAWLADRDVRAGTTEIEWDGRDQTGRRVSTGVFFARLRSGHRVRVVRLAVVR